MLLMDSGMDQGEVALRESILRYPMNALRYESSNSELHKKLVAMQRVWSNLSRNPQQNNRKTTYAIPNPNRS